MKFLFLSGHAHLAFDPATQRASGGAELQVALLARELTAAGHRVVLLGADTGQKDGVVWDGVTVRNGGRFDTGAPRDTLQAWPRVREILREEKPDAVVIYGWTTWLYLLCHLRRSIGFRLVFVCALDAEIDGDFRRENPVRGFLFDRGMRLSDARLAITEHQAALFRERGMSCAVTRLLLQRRDFYEGEKSVDLLWVARCNVVKRPQLFLDLAERLPNARCRMICSKQDSTLWQDVSRRAAGLPNVEFVESVPYREIQDHFNATRIFVNTSSHEGVPNTFIHSGLGGAAILSLAIDPDGMFRQFRAGFFAEGDFERFVAGGKKLLENPSVLADAQQECARFVREWHDNTTNLEAFLKGVTS
jgi:hypothetical protein